MAKLINADCTSCGKRNRHRNDSAGLPVKCKWCGEKYICPTSKISLVGCLAIVGLIVIIGIVGMSIVSNLDSGEGKQNTSKNNSPNQSGSIESAVEKKRNAEVEKKAKAEKAKAEQLKTVKAIIDERLRKAKAIAEKERNDKTAKLKEIEEKRRKEFRTWTSTAGTTLFARLDSVITRKVRLEKEDGSKIDVELKKLSEEDRKYVEQVTEMKKR